MFVMGQLTANSNFLPQTSSLNRNTPHERKKAYTTYRHQGQPICLDMFLVFHGVSKNKFRHIAQSLHVHGIQPRIHGNTKRLPKNTLSMASVQHTLLFLLNYSEQHGVLLPGRVPGYSRDDVRLLPSSSSRRTIHKIYLEAELLAPDITPVAYRTFCRLWQLQMPHLLLMKPMTDLCWTCQKHSTILLRAANCPSASKSGVLEAYQEHLRIVGVERSFYKTKCDDCKKKVKQHFTTEDGKFNPPPPCVTNTCQFN